MCILIISWLLNVFNIEFSNNSFNQYINFNKKVFYMDSINEFFATITKLIGIMGNSALHRRRCDILVNALASMFLPGLRPRSQWCVHREDTSLLRCLSPPKLANLMLGATLRWTRIPSRVRTLWIFQNSMTFHDLSKFSMTKVFNFLPPKFVSF